MKITAHVIIPAAYPVLLPTIRLEFTGAITDGADNNLRAMEAEVNGHVQELVQILPRPSFALAMQMRRLQMCFDIYMEVEEDLAKTSAARGANGFGKLFVRGVRFVIYIELIGEPGRNKHSPAGTSLPFIFFPLQRAGPCATVLL